MVVKLISDFGMRISDFGFGDNTNSRFGSVGVATFEKIFKSPHTKSEIRIPKSEISSLFGFVGVPDLREDIHVTPPKIRNPHSEIRNLFLVLFLSEKLT